MTLSSKSTMERLQSLCSLANLSLTAETWEEATQELLDQLQKDDRFCERAQWVNALLHAEGFCSEQSPHPPAFSESFDELNEQGLLRAGLLNSLLWEASRPDELSQRQKSRNQWRVAWISLLLRWDVEAIQTHPYLTKERKALYTWIRQSCSNSLVAQWMQTILQEELNRHDIEEKRRSPSPLPLSQRVFLATLVVALLSTFLFSVWTYRLETRIRRIKEQYQKQKIQAFAPTRPIVAEYMRKFMTKDKLLGLRKLSQRHRELAVLVKKLRLRIYLNQAVIQQNRKVPRYLSQLQNYLQFEHQTSGKKTGSTTSLQPAPKTLLHLCRKGQSRPCYAGKKGCYSKKGDFVCQSPCKAGKQVCRGEHWSHCIGEKTPLPEVCDNVDNDCDGKPDNMSFAPRCSKQQGVCKGSQQRCAGQRGWLSCSLQEYKAHHPKFQPEETLCDGLDNDCDGATDEEYADKLGQPCTSGKGFCKRRGKWVCKADGSGIVCNAKPGDPQKEVCNGKDDNCNGRIDDVKDGCEGIKQIVLGHTHTCLLRKNGKVECSGDNTYTQLGHARPKGQRGVVPGFKERVQQLAAGAYHTCALLYSGAVACWGLGEFGQLGLEKKQQQKPTQVPGLRQIKHLAAGAFHTCVLHSDGTVFCWGLHTRQLLSATDVVPQSMQRSVPKKVAGIKDAVQLTAGQSHTCALRKDKTVVCWGQNSYGQLGTQTLPKAAWNHVLGLRNVHQITAGAYHTCALLGTSPKEVKCWGHGKFGQLSHSVQQSAKPLLVKNLKGATQIAAGTYHTCALTSHPHRPVRCWGNDKFNQLQPPKSLKAKILSLAAGSARSCIHLANEKVVCWGWKRQLQARARKPRRLLKKGKACRNHRDCKTGRCEKGRCQRTKAITSHTVVKHKGAYRWSNNQVARNCSGYRFPGKGYKPANHNGGYWIKPQPKRPAFRTLCDMVYKGGGWTLLARYQNSLFLYRYDYTKHQRQDAHQGRTLPNPPDLSQPGIYGHIAYSWFSLKDAAIRLDCRKSNRGAWIQQTTALKKCWQDGTRPANKFDGRWTILARHGSSLGRSHHYICGSKRNPVTDSGNTFYAGIALCQGQNEDGLWGNHLVSFSFLPDQDTSQKYRGGLAIGCGRSGLNTRNPKAAPWQGRVWIRNNNR